MSSENLESRALALFERALDQPSSERRAWLRANAAGDEELLARALQILEADSAMGDVLRTGGAVAMGGEGPTPTHIGAYRIEALIGQGGMGTVYLGVRDSGDFEHRAAIKVVRPGALSELLVERFERERQTLATLNHPNIARLYDGGESGGAPYIVMEYVQGQPLIEWCARRNLDVAKRLRIYRDICSAVAYAHQNQVVHRDITPSNVLVTDEGVAKLIDFGIAQDAPQLAEAETSGVESKSYTPGYAAPERMAGSPGNTLSDVYSLGRLLGDLLASEPPDADLVAIAERAMQRDPGARYPSADALSEDLERYATGHVVEARDAGAGHAFAKFARRNRKFVLAASAALVLLVAAVLGTSLGLLRAERERARFELERDRANAVNRILDGMLSSASPTGDGRDVRMVDVIATAATELEADETLEDAVRASLHLTLGNTFYELGMTDEARGQFERSVQLAEACGEGGGAVWIDARANLCEVFIDLEDYGRAESEAAAVQGAVEALGDTTPDMELRPLELRAALSWSSESLEDAITLHEELLSEWLEREVPGTDNVESARENLAVALLRNDEPVEAEALLRQSYAAREAYLGPRHPKTLANASNWALTLGELGRFEEALEVLIDLAPVAEEVWGADHPRTLTVGTNLASTYLEVGELEKAYELQVVMRDRHLARFGAEHHETQLARNNLAVCAMRLERFDSAYSEFKELLEIAMRLDRVDQPQQLGMIYGNLASALSQLGRKAEALEYAELGLARHVDSFGPGHIQTLIARNNIALLLLDTGRAEEGVRQAEENLRLAEERMPDHPYNMFPFRMNYGRTLAGARRFEAAERELLSVERALEADADAAPSARARIREILGEFYDDWGKPEEARRWRLNE